MRLAALLVLLAAPGLAEEVTFPASDGVVVHADLFPHQGNRARAAVLLFHMLGSNAAEYRDIAPRLAAEGFDALAVDQRMGGSRAGVANRTMAGLTGPVMSFDAVMPDLVAAKVFAGANWPGEPVILWGSSYSADLVLALAVDDPEGVAGVLSFSPVNLMKTRDLPETVKGLTVPAFLTYSTVDNEGPVAEAVAAAAPEGLVTLDAPDPGLHGSITLDPKLNPRGSDAQWAAVEAFLARVAP